MRDIKFRAWDKECSRIFYGITINSIVDQVIEFNEHWLLHTEHELMQFTGLKDKHNKDIYEGDVVTCDMIFKYSRLPYRGVIVYDAEVGAYGTKNLSGVTLLHHHDLSTMEIVGNIYEKPVCECDDPFVVPYMPMDGFKCNKCNRMYERKEI